MIERYAAKRIPLEGSTLPTRFLTVVDQTDAESMIGKFADEDAAYNFAGALNRLENLSTELRDREEQFGYNLQAGVKPIKKGAIMALWNKITTSRRNEFWGR